MTPQRICMPGDTVTPIPILTALLPKTEAGGSGAEMVFSPKAEQLSLAASVSLLPNNLSSISREDGSTTHFYIHNATVWSTTTCSGRKEEHKLVCMFGELAAVQDIQIVDISTEQVLVVAGVGGVKFLSLYGRSLGEFQSDEANVDEPTTYKGICGTTSTLILVGNSNGEILSFSFDGSAFVLLRRTHVAETPLTQIVSTPNEEVVIAEDSGQVCVLSKDLKKKYYLIADPTDVPCHSLIAWEDYIAGGFEDGAIRFFSLKDQKLLVTVNGHARSVFALDMDASASLLVSVGIDSKAQIWRVKYPTSADVSISVELVFTATIKDRMLVGAMLLSSKEQLAITCYDSYKLVVFSKC
eukprot:gene5629-202_t